MLRRLRSKHLHKWLGGYARQLAARAWEGSPPAGPRHLLFAVCDHFEPRWRKPPADVAEARVNAWEEGYPKAVQGFRDVDGRPPRHTFFFPGEEYAPPYLEALARLSRSGYGEVELHLHHDRDTAAGLAAKVNDYLGKLAGHGHLSRDGDGRLRYAFIHGNWALANPYPDGSRCGVDAELPLLFATGCYADFTFPSAPDPSQPNVVNRIYWPVGDLDRPRCYEKSEPARVGLIRRDRILLIQGPLAITRRPGRLALRIENGDLTGHDPPSRSRVATWVGQGIHVEGRPDWVFVKTHTHGAQEQTARALLGDGFRVLHRELTTRYNDGVHWVLHYVTAREMYNIAMAAMDGRSGNPGQYRDYILPPPPVAAVRSPRLAV